MIAALIVAQQMTLAVPPRREADPFGRFESPSLMLHAQSLASSAHEDEWRFGGAFELGTPGPGDEGWMESGIAIRAHLGGGWARIGDHGGGYVAPGVRLAAAWAGEARSAQVAFGAGLLFTPVVTFLAGSERVSLSIEPGVFFRFHVFGVMVGSPFELETYGWGGAPWTRGAFGGGLAGLSIAAGLFIPGSRW